MWWRRSWFSLKGKADIPGQTKGRPATSIGPRVLPVGSLQQRAEGLPTVHEDAHRFYVHAGFRPGRPGPDPSEHVRLWMREPFLSRDYDFGKHVVHGHTPVRTGQPDQRPFRTNLDTGAVFGGALTAGVFTNDQAHAVEFLQARGGSEGGCTSQRRATSRST